MVDLFDKIMDDLFDKTTLKIFLTLVIICTFVLYKINGDFNIEHRKKAKSILDSPMLFLSGVSDGSDFIAGFLPGIILASTNRYEDQAMIQYTDKIIQNKGRWGCFINHGRFRCLTPDYFQYGGLSLFRSIHSHITDYVKFDRGIINWLFYIAGWAVPIILSLMLYYVFKPLKSLLPPTAIQRKDGESLFGYCLRCIGWSFSLLLVICLCSLAITLSPFLFPAIFLAFYILIICFIVFFIYCFIYCLLNEPSKGD